MVDADTVRDVLDALDGEWQAAVLVQLENGPRRSADLRRAVSLALDWRSFINTITRLQDKGLITRRASPRVAGSEAQAGAPGMLRKDGAREHVTYELTDAGRAVLTLLADVDAWARRHPDRTERIRRRRAR